MTKFISAQFNRPSKVRRETVIHLVMIRPVKGFQKTRGIAIAVVLALLSTECHAQSGPNPGQCDQIRAAIAQHGLEAARKHAMANYGLSPVDLRAIEQSCGIGQRDGRKRRS